MNRAPGFAAMVLLAGIGCHRPSHEWAPIGGSYHVRNISGDDRQPHIEVGEMVKGVIASIGRLPPGASRPVVGGKDLIVYEESPSRWVEDPPGIRLYRSGGGRICFRDPRGPARDLRAEPDGFSYSSGPKDAPRTRVSWEQADGFIR